MAFSGPAAKGAALVLAGALLLGGGALAVAGVGSGGPEPVPSAPRQAAAPARGSEIGLSKAIEQAQGTLERRPDDWVTWGELGLAYVQQAKITVDPSYYGKAEGALAKSLEINQQDNYIALAGQGALAAARHDFTGALAKTQAASTINPYNATVFGAMADALTQLGRYDEAEAAVQKMLSLRPGTPSFSRLSYVAELKGDIPAATAAMSAALRQAGTPADKAFAHYYLGELKFNAGDPQAALDEYRAGLQAFPADPSCSQGEAKALAALGQDDEAVAAYTELVNRVPQPSWVLEFGDLLTSLGRDEEAAAQFDTFNVIVQLFAAGGVSVDLDPALFEADHGDPAKAVEYAEAGLVVRPFLDVQDAAAWAYYRDGQQEKALELSDAALATGYRSALYRFHRGMILSALGRTDEARQELSAALELNPYFSTLHAPEAKAELARLGGAA